MNTSNNRNIESAASEAIGAVMLVSVVVLAVAIIGVALTSQPAPQKLPAVSAIISSSGNRISIYHDGGDSLNSSDLSILINGIPEPFFKSGNPAPWTWSVGDTLIYTMSSGTPTTVRIVYIPGTYTIASANFGATGSEPAPTTSVTITPPTPSTAPTVTGITPSGSNTGSIVSITNIAGTNFVSGATVRLTRFGYPDIPLSGVTVVSSTLITGSADLEGAAFGPWNVVVTNPDTQRGSLPNGFSVTNAAPTVTGITPPIGTRGMTVSINDLAGTGFLSGATVRLNRTDSTAIPATSVVVASATQITCEFTIPAGATVGTWDVFVTNPDAEEGLLANGFTVMAAGPTVTSIIPNTSLRTTPVSVSVAGTGFQSGATLRLNRTGYPDILATGVVFGSSTLITGNFNLMAATPGLWDVVVTNPDGQSGTLAAGFTIDYPAPTVTSRNNATIYRGWTGYELIGGTNFVSGAQSLINTTTGNSIPSTSCDVRSPTQMFCSYNLFGATTSTAYRVAVINPDGKSGLMTGNLVTVSSPAPTVTSLTPNTGVRGATVNINPLTGTRFQPGAIVNITRGPYVIAATNVVVVSPTQITCTFVIPSGAPTGAYSAGVLNTDGRSIVTANRFTVASSAPTVTSRNNATIYRGWTGYELIGGTNFVSGAQSLINTTTGNSIPSTSCDVRSPTQMFCSYNLLGATTSTAYRVAVINPNGESGLMTANLVSVGSPAPTIPNTPAFSPTTGVRGTTGLSITAPGTYLQPGVAVVLTRSSTTITAYNINVVSSTSVTFTIDIPAGATTGLYTARYTNTDGQTVTRTNRFTVT